MQIEIIASALFIFGYVLISMEQRFQTHKSAIALTMAGILWILLSLSPVPRETISHEIAEAGTEIFSILVFLLIAMTLVEILVHYHFFDFIRLKLAQIGGAKNKHQFIIMSWMTFFLSAIVDNLTVTIVMLQIAKRFLKGKNLLIGAAGIVIMANAGGAWSPIGDVTTLMIWLAGKFSAQQIITQAFIPAASLGAVATYLLVGQMDDTKYTSTDQLYVRLSRGEKIIIACSLGSFILPVIMNAIGLPPYLGLILGLGIVWLLIAYAKVRSKHETHLDAHIDRFLQKTDIASIQFFIGILLAVSALKAFGILEQLSHVLPREHQQISRHIFSSVLLGLASAIVDNVPLTALALDIIHISDPHLWVLLALAVGTGGSTLILGSVAGVIAMGMVKELTFEKYVKMATIPACIGYLGAIGVWFVQYQAVQIFAPLHIFAIVSMLALLIVVITIRWFASIRNK